MESVVTTRAARAALPDTLAGGLLPPARLRLAALEGPALPAPPARDGTRAATNSLLLDARAFLEPVPGEARPGAGRAAALAAAVYLVTGFRAELLAGEGLLRVETGRAGEGLAVRRYLEDRLAWLLAERDAIGCPGRLAERFIREHGPAL